MVFRNYCGPKNGDGQKGWFSGILAVDLEKSHRKTAEAENSPLGPRGKKRVRSNMKILLVRKKIVGWKNKMLVGQFPVPKMEMSGIFGIPCNARPKNGRGGEKTP